MLSFKSCATTKLMPAGPLGARLELHTRLLWCTAAFLRVALYAATYDVFPRRLSTMGAGDNMVEIKLCM